LSGQPRSDLPVPFCLDVILEPLQAGDETYLAAVVVGFSGYL